jgi:hypothetical protein
MNTDFQYQPQNDGAGNTAFEPIPPAVESRAHKGFSVASLSLGIASICTCCCCCCWLFFLPLICSILAIVFAFVAKAKAPDKKLHGLAIAGLILGIIGLVLALCLIGVIMLISTADVDSEFWAEYEAILREELGDEVFEEYFGDAFPPVATE